MQERCFVNPSVLYLLVILGPLIFGLGAAALMFWLFDAFKRNFSNLATILGWFTGNGAVIGILRFVDLSESLGLKEANGIAFLSYIGGFGSAMLLISVIRWLRQSRFAEGLHRILPRDNAEIVREVLEQGKDMAEVASDRGITVEEAKKRFADALREIGKISKRAQ